MNWIYILVLCLATYYIVARYLEKHLENFDPSLVPVSSIVTLAKVAQKLVDGGGTLTNPGNLTLGTAAAPGNLIVTGTTNLVGATTVGSTLSVKAATTTPGKIATIGNINFTQNFQNTTNGTTQSEISNDLDSKALLIVGNGAGTVPTGGVAGHNRNVHIYDNLTISNPSYQGSLTVNGNTTVTGNLAVNGNLIAPTGDITFPGVIWGSGGRADPGALSIYGKPTNFAYDVNITGTATFKFPTNAWIYSNDATPTPRMWFEAAGSTAGSTVFGTKKDYEFRGGATNATAVVKIDNYGNTTIAGSLKLGNVTKYYTNGSATPSVDGGVNFTVTTTAHVAPYKILINYYTNENTPKVGAGGGYTPDGVTFYKEPNDQYIQPYYVTPTKPFNADKTLLYSCTGLQTNKTIFWYAEITKI